MTKLDWPKYVPHLTAKDTSRNFHAPGLKNAQCLLTWIYWTFPHTHHFYEARQQICAVALLREGGNISLFSDTHTQKQRADVWNQAMENLGYTEIVDEEYRL